MRELRLLVRNNAAPHNELSPHSRAAPVVTAAAFGHSHADFCGTKPPASPNCVNYLGVRYHVSEGTLRCLSALPLRIREDERARAKARVKSKNRKRRRDGSVEAGLMEADARVDDDVRAKCQADALHEVWRRFDLK